MRKAAGLNLLSGGCHLKSKGSFMRMMLGRKQLQRWRSLFVLILVVPLTQAYVGPHASHAFLKQQRSRATRGFVPLSGPWRVNQRRIFVENYRYATSTSQAALRSPSASDLSSSSTVSAAPILPRTYETFDWKYGDEEYHINYRVEGPVDGPPLLLVHGFGGNVNHFRFQFPALAQEGYRIYAVDLLGFGASDKPGNVEYCIELFVQLLKDFVLATQPNRPWMIAGNSIGGLCCLGLAQALPNLAQGVVLFNCAGGMSGFRYEDVPWFIQIFLYILQKVVLSPWNGPRFFQSFKSRKNVENILRQQVYCNNTNVDDQLLDILLAPSEDPGATEVFLKVFAGPPGPTPESLLPQIRCPILATWGGSDNWTPHDAGAHPGCLFGEYHPDFKLEVLPFVGHCPHDEAPDQVHDKMIPWMRAVRERFNPLTPATAPAPVPSV